MALTPVNYTPHVWANGEEGGTPINATRLNEIEGGIYDGSLSINEIIEYLQTEVSITNDELYNGTYEGRNIAEIPEIQDELDQYGSIPAFLQARAQNLDSRYLRIGDWTYIDNTYMGADWRYAIYAFWPYLNNYSGAMGPHITMGPANQPYSNEIKWNTSATNNGNSANNNPYMRSNLHAVEASTILSTFATAWQNVMINAYDRLERRYSASGTLTSSNAWDWCNMGKIWSPSEVEVTGFTSVGTPIFSSGQGIQFPFFRMAARLAGKNFWVRTVRDGGNAAVGVRYLGTMTYNSADGVFPVLPCFHVG